MKWWLVCLSIDGISVSCLAFQRPRVGPPAAVLIVTWIIIVYQTLQRPATIESDLAFLFCFISDPFFNIVVLSRNKWECLHWTFSRVCVCVCERRLCCVQSFDYTWAWAQRTPPSSRVRSSSGSAVFCRAVGDSCPSGHVTQTSVWRGTSLSQLFLPRQRQSSGSSSLWSAHSPLHAGGGKQRHERKRKHLDRAGTTFVIRLHIWKT